MTEVIVTGEDAPSGEFAAGVATVVAAQAVEEAEEAQQVAEVAARAAVDAAQSAGDAASAAVAVEYSVDLLAERLEALEDFTMAGFAGVSDAIAGAEDAADEALETAVDDNGAPTPKTEETEPGPAEKPKRAKQTRETAFSNSPWFRGRK